MWRRMFRRPSKEERARRKYLALAFGQIALWVDENISPDCRSFVSMEGYRGMGVVTIKFYRPAEGDDE